MAKHVEVEISEEEFFRQRTQQIKEAREGGMEVYPHKFDAKDAFLGIREQAAKCEIAEQSTAVVKSAGRISTIRHHAKFSFLTLTSDFTDLQIILHKETDRQKRVAEFVKRGDIVGFEGHCGRSKTGEPSVFVETMTILSPCLRVIPSSRNSLTDPETIYRKRHIDLIVNRDSMKRFLDRSMIVSYIRDYFHRMNFVEVETPMMSTSAGGAAARPFVTHHNELKLDLFMRVAPELFLKKLIIGGMSRVFEIGRNFRNEGIDLTHNPEFTAIEFYMAYVDYRDIMGIVEDLLSKLVVKMKGSEKFTYRPIKRGGEEVVVDLDFSAPFQRLDILEEINSVLGLQLTGENISEPESLELLIQAAEKNSLEIAEPKTLNRVLDAFIGEYIEPRCINPTFVTGFPVAMSPLAKDDRNRKGITERFEMFLNGKEICNAYTELNIPEVQRERFLMQTADANAGDDEAMPADEDFCQALEFALPPTGGCGIGIDRLVMYLTNAANIRDVILFPAMKPENN